MINDYENDDIRVDVRASTISIYYKKTNELVIAEFKYVIRLDVSKTLDSVAGAPE